MRRGSLLAVGMAWAVCGLPVTSAQGPDPARISTKLGDHVILEIAVEDRAPRDGAAVGALLLRVNGRENQHVLATPGSGRASYEALLGPFDTGEQLITVEQSPWWPWPSDFAMRGITGRIVSASAPESTALAYAPSFGIRADTIGTASDVPLVLYVEDDRRDGKGWLRYSAIMSHEDGGTAAPALMARWGRTTDIELAYEVELDGARLVQDRFQGPDHEIRAFAGAREGHHPYLLIATLNNMFIDRGRSLATVRLVPRRVNLEGRTRESVMDEHLWIYPLMARELRAEKRIGTQIEDPREFLYVEAKLDLAHAAASVRVGSDATGWKDSTRGRPELAVNRNGWVRIAVHAPAAATSMRWECRALASAPAGAAPRCNIEWNRVFRLGLDYLPGPNQATHGKVVMGVGLSEPVALN
jgi:hypothetical protein